MSNSCEDLTGCMELDDDEIESLQSAAEDIEKADDALHRADLDLKIARCKFERLVNAMRIERRLSSKECVFDADLFAFVPVTIEKECCGEGCCDSNNTPN